MEIIETSVILAWKRALREILDSGQEFVDREGRKCREILNFSVEVKNPENDYEAPINSMREFDFLYPSKEELTAIIMNKEELSGYEFSYGPRIFGEKDQINDFVIPLLKKDPTSRRAIVSVFDPKRDSDPLSKNIPSLMYIYFKVVKGKLNLTCYIRSNDFFIGWPGNIYQIFILQKYVSEKLSMPIGSLITISSSAHIFEENLPMINKILS